MTNRWTSDYDSDELQELERRASAIDRRSDEIESRIQELERDLARLNEEGERVELQGSTLAAAIRAEDEGITVAEARRLNEAELQASFRPEPRERFYVG